MTIANALLVGQVAFSFLLLVTAALFLRSIGRAYQMDPGFQTAHLVVFPTNPGQAGYGKAQTKAFYHDVRERVSSIPGVASVSWASGMPLWANSVSGFQVEGLATGDRGRIRSGRWSTPWTATTSRPPACRLRDGRAFTSADQETSAAGGHRQ